MAHAADFLDRIEVALDVRVGSDVFSIAAGSIERLQIAALTYGFEAEVVFTVSSELEPDALFSRVCSNDLLAATLTVANGNEPAPRAAMKLSGYVTERRIAETVSDDVQGAPVVGRRYTVTIVDAAQAFWRQHRPLELYAGVSMKQAIEQHICPGMRLDIAWPRLDEAADVLCIGLGGESEASFYDFVMWIVHENHGVIELDAAEGRYRLAPSKARGGAETSLDADLVGEVRVVVEEPPRHTAAVLNAFAEAAVREKSLANDAAVTGVRRDALVRTAVEAGLERRAAIEEKRLAPGEHGIDITLRRCPPSLSPPGSAVALGEEFSDKLYPAGKKYRVVAFALSAAREEGAAAPDLDDDTARFQMTLRLRAERQSDPTPRLPAFRRPSYPVVVEGRIKSASGADGERTWHALEGELDSLHRVQIHIPLWNQAVVAAFAPRHVPGHFFFPPYKDQRVLVAIDVDSARISGYLDWAGRLPQGEQGNQILLGKKTEDETSLRHAYEDDKPVLRVERRLAGDIETVVLSEGTIKLEVKEIPTAPAASPSYDLRPTVDAAKERVSSEVRGAVSSVTAALETTTSGVSQSLEGARAEVEAKVTQATSTLSGNIESVEADLRGMMSSAAASLATVATSVSEAKAAILAALVA